jgi:hypothetical protein
MMTTTQTAPQDPQAPAMKKMMIATGGMTMGAYQRRTRTAARVSSCCPRRGPQEGIIKMAEAAETSLSQRSPRKLGKSSHLLINLVFSLEEGDEDYYETI